MRTISAATFVGLLLLSPIGRAQSVFNGTWRPDPQVFGANQAPDAAEFADGVYQCKTCEPPYQIKADAGDQPLAGNPYFDTLSIMTIDARTIHRIGKKAGKTVAETKVVVSADGRTKTEVQTLFDMAPRPIEMTTHASRVAAGPAGSHVVSGTWRMTDEESDRKGGKVVKISRWSIGPDGKTLHARFDDTHGRVQEQTGHKVK